jgi:hypothetical protein
VNGVQVGDVGSGREGQVHALALADTLLPVGRVLDDPSLLLRG